MFVRSGSRVGGCVAIAALGLSPLVAACGDDLDHQKALIRDDGPAVLTEAEGRLDSLPYPVADDARCWFDRLPSDSLQVVCGPLTTTATGAGANPGGPPYFYAMSLVELGNPKVTELRLTADEPYQAVLSFENYPVSLFRPDGEKLDPAAAQP